MGFCFGVRVGQGGEERLEEEEGWPEVLGFESSYAVLEIDCRC